MHSLSRALGWLLLLLLALPLGEALTFNVDPAKASAGRRPPRRLLPAPLARPRPLAQSHSARWQEGALPGRTSHSVATRAAHYAGSMRPSAVRAAITAEPPVRIHHTVSFTKTDSAPAHVDDGGSRRNACSMRSTAARK
jgi:hypothetical protein